MKIETYSADETFALGRKMGREAKPGEVIALSGDLGAGKTVFTQGFADGLGIQELVTSPTFTIWQSYNGGRLVLNHFDVYRLEDIDEMDEIGYEDAFYGGGVTLVEWPERIRELLPENTVWIRIDRDPMRGDDFRSIMIENNLSDRKAHL